MDLGLDGRKAVVAGGSRGIGKAIAIVLAREGVDLALVARNKDELEATATEIAAGSGRRALAISCDVTRRGDVEAMIAKSAEQLGGLDILINSAAAPGGSPSAIGAIEDIVDEDFLNDFDTKYMGTLRCTRAAIPLMKKAGWGRIINISGGNARTPGDLSGGARNSALVHFSRTMALQLGRDGITVNCIHPGPTRTERTARQLAERSQKLGIPPGEVEAGDYAKGGPRANAIGRMVDASEIGELAAFLVSDRAAAITGELISPNGGAGGGVYY